MYQSRWAPKPPPAEEEEKPQESQPKPAEPKPAEPKKVEEPAVEEKAEEERPTSSSLSAAADNFAPTPNAHEEPPHPEYSSYDSFAQTGADQDDLFDDVIPMDESMRLQADEDLFNDDFTPVPEPVVGDVTAPVPATATVPATVPEPESTATAQRGDGGRGRGRGRGRGGRGRGTTTQPRGGAGTQTQPTQAPPAAAAQTQAPAEASESAPTGPRKDSVPSVRGDRHATGGLKKPKLTEAELAEKMAQIQIKNATLTAAHARAEADAASFAQRETKAKEIATQKQKEERRDRQQMMGEREKNRMRKLKAMEGREWDAEKNEDDFRRGGTYDKKNSTVGDEKDNTDGREYLYKESRGGDRGRGSGRGGRGGRTQEQSAPKKEEFPELPSKGGNKSDAAVVSSISDGPKTSWADQVESSNA